MKNNIKKAYAYIIQNNKLLVFSEPDFPEVGLQIPGGTVEDNEDLEEAIKREVFEETGLTNFEIKKYLGSDIFEKNNKFYERNFFQIELIEETPETWIHVEKFPSEGTEKEIIFKFIWKNLIHDYIDLGVQGVFLNQIKNNSTQQQNMSDI